MNSIEFLLAMLCVFSASAVMLRAENGFVSDFSHAGNAMLGRSAAASCSAISDFLFSFGEGSVLVPGKCRSFFQQGNSSAKIVGHQQLSFFSGKHFLSGATHYG